jgi:hypothetical protein
MWTLISSNTAYTSGTDIPVTGTYSTYQFFFRPGTSAGVAGLVEIVLRGGGTNFSHDWGSAQLQTSYTYSSGSGSAYVRLLPSSFNIFVTGTVIFDYLTGTQVRGWGEAALGNSPISVSMTAFNAANSNPLDNIRFVFAGSGATMEVSLWGMNA